MAVEPKKKVNDETVNVSQSKDKEPVKAGYKEVFCKYITKNGKRIYPNGKAFRFIVKI
jgi:hypothetical protein